MSTDASYDLAIFQLVIYVILLPPSTFVLFRHGLRNLPAWFFLSGFLASQIVGAALVIAAGKTGFSIAGSILIQVGLSPLLLALHGALVQALAGHLFLHVAVVAPAALLGYGTSQLYMANGDVSTGTVLRKVGAVLYVVAWAILSSLIGLCLLRLKDLRSQRWLVISSAITSPLFAIRIIYSLLAVFDTSSSTFSIIGGSVTARVLMLILPLMGVAAVMTVAGIMTPSPKSLETRNGYAQHDLELGK